jgi:2-phosphosulfolactate phosphatase
MNASGLWPGKGVTLPGDDRPQVSAMPREGSARFVSRSEAVGIIGAVVVVDVLRAFSTAAYAFAAGARHIFLVSEVDEALAFKRENPDSLAMGEIRGQRPDGFDFSNSPVAIASQDLRGRTLVQRTSAGTQGAVAARSATRLWCASLVTASATAAALKASGLGPPAYVITGRSDAAAPPSGFDDLATAEHIESLRLGAPLDSAVTRAKIASSEEARRTLSLGPGHVDPRDIAFCTDIDRFDFALEVTRVGGQLRLDRVQVLGTPPAP